MNRSNGTECAGTDSASRPPALQVELWVQGEAQREHVEPDILQMTPTRNVSSRRGGGILRVSALYLCREPVADRRWKNELARKLIGDVPHKWFALCFLRSWPGL